MSACGGSGAEGGKPFPDDAWQELTSWQDRLIKTCSLADAMPSLGTEYGLAPLSVDIAHFFAATDGRGLLQTQGGETIGFAASRFEPGVTAETHKSNDNRSAGDGYEATARLEDGMCVITVDGDEVARTTVATAGPIVIHTFDAELDVLISQRFRYRLTQNADAGFGVIESDSLLALAWYTLAADSGVYSGLRSLFAGAFSDLLDAELEQLFPISDAALASTVRVGDIYSDAETVYGQIDEVIAPLAEGGNGTLPFELLIQPPSYGVPVADDARLWTIDMTLSVADRALQDDDAFESTARITALRPQQVDTSATRSDAEASACVLRRFDVVGHLTRAPLDYGQVTAGCGLLTETSLERALAGSADGRARIADEALTRLQEALDGGGDAVRYGGWDRAFANLLTAVLQETPEHDGVLAALAELFVGYRDITDADDAIATLSAAIADRSLGQDHLPAAAESVILRAFIGPQPANQALTAAQIDDIAQAINRHGSVLERAVARMLHELKASSAGDAALACAALMPEDVRDQGGALIAAASALDAAESWAELAAEEVFLSCWTSDVIRAFNATLDALTSFAQTEAERVTDTDVAYRDDLASIGSRAMEETWSSQTFDHMQRIIEYAIATFHYDNCQFPGTLSGRARCLESGGFSPLSADAGAVFDPAFAGRYVALAEEMGSRDWLADVDYALLPLERELFGSEPVWTVCDNDSFQRGQERYLALLDAYRGADFFEQADIYSELQNVLYQCQ